MKTYQIKWFGTIYKTVEIKATDEDEAMDLFNSGEGEVISLITKHDDIDEIKEIKNVWLIYAQPPISTW